MQEEVTSKTIALCIRTVKFSTELFGKAIQAYLRNQQQKAKQKQAEKPQIKQGKIKVKDLAAQNAGMVNIEITKKNIKGFERYARQYGIQYALKKDPSKDPPVYLVFFKGRDQNAIEAAFRAYSNAELKKANRPSIRKRLQKYKEMTQNFTKGKVKQKHQQMER